MALLTLPLAAAFVDSSADTNALPSAPPGFQVTLFAKEPLVRQPCSMAFDSRGRLFVGMGPQYRHPTPDTPGDSVVIVNDTNGDGVADSTNVFASGFNAIQSMAWRGRDLWLANAPDLTVVRDLDGDDEADEYIRIYTDLGNLEHGLHGLNWAPDGKLYMSKGNSKGINRPDRYAPKVFRDLWGMPSPPGARDLPEPQTFKKGEYQHAYHDPRDDWGREGGVLRCDDGGRNLELIARGCRNPWDIGFDNGFNWLGTDNDQTAGDRILMPFRGAHFGWNHPWSAGWADNDHAPTAPVSGPVFEGSGTGIVFGDSPQFPPEFRAVWFMNDWLRKTMFVYRPQWQGALLQPARGKWELFLKGGDSLFRPTDVGFGPDGALWCLGWSRGYGVEWKHGQMMNEGRIFRIAWKDASPLRTRPTTPLDRWSARELMADFEGPLPSWRIDAQDELVRRGAAVRAELTAALETKRLTEAQQTWTIWALGRMRLDEASFDDYFSRLATSGGHPLNLRLQAIRILGQRARQSSRWSASFPAAVHAALQDPEPRLRLAAIQAVAEARLGASLPTLAKLLAIEEDRVTFYAAWQTLRSLASKEQLQALLGSAESGTRRGALLALLEDNALTQEEVKPLAADRDKRVREIASLWLRKTSGGLPEPIIAGRRLDMAGIYNPVVAIGPIPAGVARNVKARSERLYQLSPGGLRAGARVFTDRHYTLKHVPESLEGADYIQTANDDDGCTGPAWLTFEALLPVRVHVAMDRRHPAPPRWLLEGWQPGEALEADHWTYRLHSRAFPAGPIALGGLTDDGQEGGKSQYLIALETLPLAPPEEPASLEQVLPYLAKADTARGAALFQQRGAAGCFLCHRVNGYGNAFAPDLSDIGARADARHIIESMLSPNAVITEGFKLVTVETADEQHSGVLLEESGLTLALGLPAGQRINIEKAKVKSRHVSDLSAMPAYASLLLPQYLADITAWLLSRQTPPAASGTQDSKTPTPPGRSGF